MGIKGLTVALASVDRAESDLFRNDCILESIINRLVSDKFCRNSNITTASALLYSTSTDIWTAAVQSGIRTGNE